MAKVAKKNEISWTCGRDENGKLQYTITSNIDRSWYYIYDSDGNRLGKARTPIELEDEFFAEE